MDAATRSRIFEPCLFDQGTGSRYRSWPGDGVWRRQAVRRKSSWSQRARSRDVIQEFLPRFAGIQEVPEAPEVVPPQAEVPRSIILIVEDEQQVRLVARRPARAAGPYGA